MQETYKQQIRLFLMVFTIFLPVVLLGVPPQVATAKEIAGYASSVLGLSGIAMLLWMYTLGTRAVSGLFVRDMSSSLKIHGWLGKYGTLLIFAHPFIASYFYGESIVAYWLNISFDGQFNTFMTLGRFAIYTLLIIWVTSALLRSKIRYRPWKYIHYLSYIALPLSLLHVLIVGSSLDTRAGVRFYVYVAVAMWALVSLLRLRHILGLGKLSYTVVSHDDFSPGIKRLQLRANKKHLDGYKGSYVYLQTSRFGEEHPFSLLGYNNDTKMLTVGYKQFGRFTHKIGRTLTNGAVVYVDGPYGIFTSDIDTHTDPVVFISGGIGITPFVQSVLSLSDREVWLFSANQSRESAILRQQLSEKLGGRAVFVYNKEQLPLEANEVHGYVNAELLSKYLQSPMNYQYYICGPSPMMRAVRTELESMGVDPPRIHTEEFSF